MSDPFLTISIELNRISTSLEIIRDEIANSDQFSLDQLATLCEDFDQLFAKIFHLIAPLRAAKATKWLELHPAPPNTSSPRPPVRRLTAAEAAESFDI